MAAAAQPNNDIARAAGDKTGRQLALAKRWGIGLQPIVQRAELVWRE